MVIVLYRTKYYETKTYKTFLKYLSGYNIFIYDNSPTIQYLENKLDTNNYIYYVSDITNSGLSIAYNQAAKYALEVGCDWMMLLDQDTMFSPLIIQEFEQLLNNDKYSSIKLFVPPVRVTNGKYISPAKIRHYRAKMSLDRPHGVVSSIEYAPINSGMIINVSSYLNVGGYNENVWLDYSDFQFMERFSKKYTVFYVLDTECEQEFSNLIQTNEQKLVRFGIYCECLNNFEKHTLIDKILFFILVLRRTISLVYKTNNIDFFSVFICKYLFSKKTIKTNTDCITQN